MKDKNSSFLILRIKFNYDKLTFNNHIFIIKLI